MLQVWICQTESVVVCLYWGGKPNRTKMYGKLIYQSVPSSVIRGRDVITPAYFL